MSHSNPIYELRCLLCQWDWPTLEENEKKCMRYAKEFLDAMDEFDPDWRNKG